MAGIEPGGEGELSRRTDPESPIYRQIPSIAETMERSLVSTAEAEAEGRLIRLHYAGESAMSAADLAGVLEGLVGLVDEAGRLGLLGEGPPPEVLVEPPEEGSFEIFAILQWAMENPGIAGGLATSAGGNVVMFTRWLIRFIRGDLDDYDYLDDGNEVKVKWKDGTTEPVPRDVWKRFEKLPRKTKRNLQKLLAPTSERDEPLTLSSDPDGPGPEEPVSLVADRVDYRAALNADDPTEERSEFFETEGTLRMIDFDPDRAWRIRTPYGSRNASMEDLEFQKKLRDGLALKETDIFQFLIREDVTVTSGKTSTKWTIESVLSHRRAAGDADGDGSTNTEQT